MEEGGGEGRKRGRSVPIAGSHARSAPPGTCSALVGEGERGCARARGVGLIWKDEWDFVVRELPKSAPLSFLSCEGRREK